MRTVFVIVDPPSVDLLPGFVKRKKLVEVQAFISEAAVVHLNTFPFASNRQDVLPGGDDVIASQTMIDRDRQTLSTAITTTVKARIRLSLNSPSATKFVLQHLLMVESAGRLRCRLSPFSQWILGVFF